VQAVFSWSYRNLSPLGARMFRLLGAHPGPDISAAAAASLAAIPLAQARKALSELVHAHLLSEHVPGRFTFHDLLHAYAAQQPPAPVDAASAAAVQNERRTALRRVLEHYLHTASAGALLLSPGQEPMALHQLSPGVRPESLFDDRRALDWFEAEHEVLLAAVALAASMGFDRLAWQLPLAFGVFLDWRGHRGDWAAVQRTAVESARRAADRQAQAGAHRQLGRAYIRLRCYDKASMQLSQASDLYVQSADLAGQARTCLDAARVLQKLHHDEEALGNALRAVRLFQAIGDDAGRAKALDEVGWCHTLRGEERQALSYCGQALDLYRVLGDRQGEAATSGNLGTAHYHLGDYPHAVAYFEHACNLYRALGDRTHLANSLDRLGDTRDASGDPEAACDAWQGALTLLEDLGHPGADEVRTKLGRIGMDLAYWPQPTLRA
jgi:tetratricopeptide (TPR) repeat protein